MMTLPFVTLFVGLVCAWRGHRLWGIGFWMVTLGLLLVLFRLHATSALQLQF